MGRIFYAVGFLALLCFALNECGKELGCRGCPAHIHVGDVHRHERIMGDDERRSDRGDDILYS